MSTLITAVAVAAALLAAPAAASAAPADAPTGSASSGSSDLLIYVIRCLPIGPLVALSSGMPDDGIVDPSPCAA
ncbi:hypothetical protein [Nocardia farcinica]|uniref:hypothetical protein n=1 Tax=Nocardia farcinica TaxID=37329 RepID=UPI001895B2BD|nr:hypothetical protein [Nocardia farcinica]MBF6520557.1 hypothetical protein [Nocardia farcinica]